ncbi:discoidin domain-containing protein [Amycolatopsis coloradensis]|uniref:discoidin domain-containing protein n=1 Tax=Amycolatopsis coloradensis TaxID=76021 RepID=UPI001FCA17A7|nr:discoidin domain-containing protein [Amycolatopsis coloradensis]
MVDGDPETFYWSDWAPRAGDAIGVDLGTAQPVSHVDILMGKPTSPDDFVRNGVREYSSDGQQWTVVKTVTEPVISADLPDGAKARFVRVLWRLCPVLSAARVLPPSAKATRSVPWRSEDEPTSPRSPRRACR